MNTPACADRGVRGSGTLRVVRKCILHFGFHKTGTSSIQQALFTRVTGGAAACIHFGKPFIGRALITAFCTDPSRLAPDLGMVDAAGRRAARESLRAVIAGHSAPRLIISTETLACFSESELRDVVEFLEGQGLAVEAVAYVRDYGRWCESFLQQSVKYGLWPMSVFPLRIGVYRRAVEALDRVLGRENVSLWKYERRLFPEGCVVRDFFTRLRLGDCGEARVELNEGLSIDAVRLLRAFHASGLRPVIDRASFERNARLAHHVATLAGHPVRIDPALLAEQSICDAADLDWIEARLGQSIRPVACDPPEGETIRSEADLDRFTPTSLQWLERESGVRVTPGDDAGETSLAVAKAMVELQDRMCAVARPFVFDLSPRRSPPKILWMSWIQGMDKAPDLVKRCVASWQEFNPGWEIRVLDGPAAEPYLRRADVPAHRLAALPPEKRANILRMRLLTEEGGVWADASTYCLRPLDEWLPACMGAGFFCFRDPGPDRLVTNWFLASERGGRLATLWRDAHEAFWRDRDYLHHSSYDTTQTDLPSVQRALLRLLHAVLDRNARLTDLWFHPLVRSVLRTYPYCVMHYLFAYGCRHEPEWAEIFKRMPWHDAKPLLQACRLPPGTTSYHDVVEAGRTAGLPLMKLDWRTHWLDDQTGS